MGGSIPTAGIKPATTRRSVQVLYVYVWKNNEKRRTMRGRECHVLARGAMNSIMIEFTDNGQKEIVSRHSVRLKSKFKPQRKEKV